MKTSRMYSFTCALKTQALLFQKPFQTLNENTESIKAFTAQKMKFSIKDVFSKCDLIPNLVTFTEEILSGKLHFLCSVYATRKRLSRQ